MDTIDIHIKLEYPVIPSSWGLSDLLLLTTNNHTFSQSEVVFRIPCDTPLVRFSLGAISWIPKNLFQYIEKLELSFPVEKQVLKPQWVTESCRSIESGNMKLCSSGVGGTYFVGLDQITSVFKPVDEEPGSPNCPKKVENFVPMMTWGNGAHREVAAYKIDNSFAGVPETHLVELNVDGTSKQGSLQKFINNDGDCSDLGSSKFSVENVHRLGILDVRILNMDRNDENVLVQKSENEWKLIPIDHTYAFPRKIDSYFNWQYWSQTKKPFSMENLSYISSIDVLSDARLLLETGIDKESIRNVIGSTLLLQKAAALGFNLFQIASMVSGSRNDLVSLLSKVKDENQSGSDPMEKFARFKCDMEKVIEEFLLLKKC